MTIFDILGSSVPMRVVAMVRDLINRLGGDIVLAILASSLFASIAIGRGVR